MLRYYNHEIIIINTKTHFHTAEKLFELFCMENNFLYILQNAAIYLFKYLYITILLQDKSISLHCIILQNPFLAPE